MNVFCAKYISGFLFLLLLISCEDDSNIEGPVVVDNDTVDTSTITVDQTDTNTIDQTDTNTVVIDDVDTDTTIVDDAIVYEDISIDGANISWENWYLSVPIDNGSGKATSIYYEEIEADNLTLDQKEYFDFNDDGSFKMNTIFTGYTTSGEYELFEGRYCRTELREYWQGIQSTSDNWYFDDEIHILESTLSVDKIEGESRVFVGQIHGKEGVDINGAESLSKSPATVKVEWIEGDIRLEYYTEGGKDDDDEWTSSSGVEKIVIGEVDHDVFTIRIKVDKGVLYFALTCEATGVDTGYIEYYDYAAADYGYQNYFKTGNYFRHDEDYTSESQVTLYSAYTYHSELD